MSELQAYAGAQFNQITSLNKKLSKLEEENAHLKKLIDSGVPALKEAGQLIDLGLQISNEELICVTQIKMLKESALNRELTLEEAKKADIYIKILSGLNAGKKPEIQIQSSQLSERELLQLVEGHKD